MVVFDKPEIVEEIFTWLMVSELKSMGAWVQDLVENMMVSELQSMVAWLQILAEHSMKVRIRVIIKKYIGILQRNRQDSETVG